MEVIYYSKTRKRRIESELDITYVPLEELLQRSDFVSIHVSLNKDSFHMIDESKFRLMKKTAFIINTSRGKVINEHHLISGRHGGGGASRAGSSLSAVDCDETYHLCCRQSRVCS